MTPGELLIDDGEHAINTGRRTLTLLVKNASEQGYAALMALKDKLVAGYSGEGEA